MLNLICNTKCYYENKSLEDIQCNDSPRPANGKIVSCSSGGVRVGYTCNFTCNTGYQLTGTDTRTCQRNGIWSGSDDACRRGIL